MMVYKRVNSTSHLEFHTEMKIAKSSLFQKLFLLLHAGSVELVPLVQGGHPIIIISNHYKRELQKFYSDSIVADFITMCRGLYLSLFLSTCLYLYLSV